ncbi:hypothetical protein [Nocardia arizonensis]|uniref:hypothetical protein n=1 Tax=Nocardia arizonensis TaxID=1141647 RepID=UPI0006D026DA|nr:hypothetical protein [Nocardia arizonensis]
MPAIPRTRISAPPSVPIGVRLRRCGAAAISTLATVLLIGVGAVSPARAQPATGLYTIRPFAHLDRVLTVDPTSKAAICEPDADDPAQSIRLRPVRGRYTFLDQRIIEYLDYAADGRAVWTDRITMWDVIPASGFGSDVFMIRRSDTGGAPDEVLTCSEGDDCGVIQLGPTGDGAPESRLWKFELASGAHSGVAIRVGLGETGPHRV